ncbi:hypothetical protein FDC45_09965 [Clostridium botulinum]|uniref:Uncharacterized protein n=1 Tax=Clostridium botulinum TaxID=1491 RepID=A0A846J7W4_CLOBO|nr:hypothetical protein CLK_0652 [Clostridium botulinum A3 str. Loch Maree]NFH66026.1 hypothetical protein [Clostridium botulinum]NFJ09989.1 hypothetical protein [Clostridium botulinum]NFK15770.1 hypothetical protein [Clostridium botulinum]NFM94068.1 hypothetical protein [Clostridium botulinum]
MLTNIFELKTYNIKVQDIQGIYFNKDIISLLFTNMYLKEYYIKGRELKIFIKIIKVILSNKRACPS